MNKYTKLYLSAAVLYVAGISVGYFLASTPACCEENKILSNHQQKEITKMVQYGHIDAKSLKNLIDTKASMVILDARTQEWDDGRRISEAKSLPFDSDLKAIAKAAPDKDALIVVYCFSIQCPAGKKLAEKLVAEGYTHVLEYAGGIKEWSEEMGYATQGKAAFKREVQHGVNYY